jgi:hypothetical protein
MLILKILGHRFPNTQEQFTRGKVQRISRTAGARDSAKRLLKFNDVPGKIPQLLLEMLALQRQKWI